MDLNVVSRERDGILVLYCQGRLVHVREAALLLTTVRGLLQKHNSLVINLEGVHAVDSGGLGCLAVIHLECVRRGAAFKYCCVSPRFHHLLHLCGLAEFFDIYPTEELAVGAFSARVA